MSPYVTMLIERYKAEKDTYVKGIIKGKLANMIEQNFNIDSDVAELVCDFLINGSVSITHDMEETFNIGQFEMSLRLLIGRKFNKKTIGNNDDVAITYTMK